MFPPYNEEEFNKKVKEQMIIKINNNKKIKGELSDTWLFNENESEPKPLSGKIKLYDDFIKETKKIEGKNLDLNLDILKMKDLSEASSLDKIISVLNNGFSISQAFIFCIGKLDKDKINEIFNYLYEIYHISKSSTKSILSNEIKLFTNSFENMCRSLKGLDVDLSKFEDLTKLKKKKELIINEEKPSPILYSFPTGIYWRGTTTSLSRYDDKKFEEKETKITIESEITTSEKKPVKKDEVPEKKKEKEKIELSKVEFGKIGEKASDILDYESENEEENEIKELEKIHLKKTDTIKEAKEEEINKLKAVSDEGVTNAIVKRMLNKKIDSNLKLTENFPEFKSDIYGDRENILKKTSNRKEGDDYISQPLYGLINDLSKNIYIKLFQQCINFDRKEVCAVIGIDLCRTIGKKFKLFHTIIATSMAHCFNSIEIPYSIVVFCDYGVQFIIKDFEEPHQEEISQLIFDSIMVPRCSTRIADVCYFISQKVNCKDRINKRVFIISNGLDTRLKIGEKWAPICSNEKEKFCFYFIKPVLNKIEINEIIKKWNDFQEKTKIKLTIISQEEILNRNSSTFLAFKSIMQSKTFSNIELPKKLKISQPEFKEIVKFNKEDYIKILNSINSEIINAHDYFVQNRLHIASKGKYKLEDFIVKNPFTTLKGECNNKEYNLE